MLELEREYVREAARGAVDPDALIEHAQSRSIDLSAEYVVDPLTIKPGRDRARDVREEIADAVNHTVMHFQENAEDERNPDYQIGLRFLALAYDRFKPEL